MLPAVPLVGVRVLWLIGIGILDEDGVLILYELVGTGMLDDDGVRDRAPPLASEGVSTSETKFKAINSSSWSSGTSLKASIEAAVPCPSLFRPKVWYLGIKDRPSFRSRSEEVARLRGVLAADEFFELVVEE
jgi:hypothetical protein